MEQSVMQILLGLVKKSVTSYAAYTKASKQGTAEGEELKKLEATAKADRAAFDTKLAEAIGDVNTDAGRVNARDWGFYVQKAYIFGLVNEQAFRYVRAEKGRVYELRRVANLVMKGNRLLGRTVEHSVNPRSVSTLLGGLEKELKSAETEGTDPNRIGELRATHGELDRCTRQMRARADARRSQTNPTTAAAPIGEQVGEATAKKAGEAAS